MIHMADLIMKRGDYLMSEILLSIVTICTCISYLPQTIKLIKTKKSNDISIKSWILWVTSSLSYTLYGYLCTNDFMLRLETTLEFSFCLIIMMLAIIYRKNK